jgi:hypothetical protein
MLQVHIPGYDYEPESLGDFSFASFSLLRSGDRDACSALRRPSEEEVSRITRDALTKYPALCCKLCACCKVNRAMQYMHAPCFASTLCLCRCCWMLSSMSLCEAAAYIHRRPFTNRLATDPPRDTHAHDPINNPANSKASIS